MPEFPTIKDFGGTLDFIDGSIVPLPNEYKKEENKSTLIDFYARVISEHHEEVMLVADPLGFCYIQYKDLLYVGLVIGVKDSGFSRLKKKYHLNRFEKDYIIQRIKAEYALLYSEEYIPIKLATQNLHEIRNLNSKISAIVDGIIDAESEVDWEGKFENQTENVRKVYVASRLIKFILDNITFLSPNYFNTLKQNMDRSFILHRCVSKIVKIYREEFKKKKSNIQFDGNSFKRMYGDKELFEIVLMLLVENAIKYSNDLSSIPPRVEVKDENERTLISVSSFGLIIPEKDRNKIFSRGFRSESHKVIGGTGMGLHNANEILKVFNSKLIYSASESQKDIGWNTFTVTCLNVF